MPAERGPSGTGHDTSGRRCGLHQVAGEHLPCPVCTEMTEPPPVAVPGPASVSPAEPPPIRHCGHRTLHRSHEYEEQAAWEGVSLSGATLVSADPVVSPADTRQAQQHATHVLGSVLTWGGVKELIGTDLYDRSVRALRALDDLWDDRERLLAVGEQDKAAELGPVPTDAGGPGKEETYWLTQKLNASIRHLRDIEDYYRPTGLPGSYNRQRADRARVLYEQITADFLHGKMGEPPEIVALREAGERDRRRIARLTEALERLAREVENECRGRPSKQRLRHRVTSARAVLAGEEDARATVVKDNAPTGGLDSWDF